MIVDLLEIEMEGKAPLNLKLGSVHILRHQLLANSGPPTPPCVIKIIMALDPPPPLK